MKLKFLAAAIALSLLINIFTGGILTMASGDYLALGDSITTGYGLEDASNGFAELLAKDNGYTLYNHAKNGATAEDVLELMVGGTIDEKIKSAQIITLTCGGNDLMNVLYSRVADKYNENSKTPIQSGEVLSIISNPADSRRNALSMTVLSVLSGNGSDMPAFAQSPAFLEALDLYTERLGMIVSHIRALNPSATVIVATQYNPYKAFSGFLKALNTGVNSCVVKLNEAIRANANVIDYTVADVYQAFEKYGKSLYNADASSMNFDFHPSAEGHKVIADCINGVINQTKADLAAPEATAPAIMFEDVGADNWYYDAVDFVCRHGLFNGVTESKFCPDDPMSRAMLVTVLYRAEGEPEVNGNSSFADVEEGSYYERAVTWAKENGVVTGVTDTEFAPNLNVTREQIAAIILRYAGLKGEAPVGAWAIRLDYADTDRISDYALSGVMYCTMKGIMHGKGEKLFAPKDNATRAELASVLKNILSSAQ